MTIADGGTMGSTGNTSGATTIVLTTTTNAASAGDYVIVIVAKDNAGVADAATEEVTVISDSAGSNGWSRLGEYSRGSPGAAAGAVISAWGARLTNAIGIGATITATFSGSTTAKCIGARRFTCDSTKVLRTAGTLQTVAENTSTPTELTISGLASAQTLWVWASGLENGTPAWTLPSGWTTFVEQSTGSGTSGMSAGASFFLSTATTKTASSMASTTADQASIMVALREVDATLPMAAI